jgi:L-asparaginase
MQSGEEGGVPELSADRLLAGVPRLGDVAEVSVATAAMVPGASLTFPDLVAVAEEARLAVRDGATGVVITQGTDTIEETAYLWHLIWHETAPFVVTGAMRLAGTPGADGPANILAAVTVAAHPASRNRGVLVAFGDEIHAARRVTKSHSTRVAAFTSPESGPLGRVMEGRVTFWTSGPDRGRPIAGFGGPVPEVALVPVLLGDSGAVLQSAAAIASGIVLAAMGAGHVPAVMLDGIEATVAAMPMAFSTRTGAGPVLHRTYSFRGSERDLHRLGLLDAGDLAPLKARVLLTAAMWSTVDRADQETVFAAHAMP